MNTPDPAALIPLAPTLSSRVMAPGEYHAADPGGDLVDELLRAAPPARNPLAPTAQDERARRERIKSGYSPPTSNVGPGGVAQSKSEARSEAAAAWRASGRIIPRAPERMPRIEYVPDTIPETAAHQPGPTGERAHALAIARLGLSPEVDPLDTATAVLPDPWGLLKPPHWLPDAMAFVLSDFELPVQGTPRYKRQRPPIYTVKAVEVATDEFGGLDHEAMLMLQALTRADLSAPRRPAEDRVRKASDGYSLRQCAPIPTFYGCRKAAKGWIFHDKPSKPVPEPQRKLGTHGIIDLSNGVERGDPAVIQPVFLLAA